MSSLPIEITQKLDAGLLSTLRRHQQDVYVRLLPIFSELGVRIEVKELPEGQRGYASHYEGTSPSGFVVTLNGNQSPEWRRFTAAHELGHCLLHTFAVNERLIDRVNFGGASDLLLDWREDLIEREADCFSCLLLMPVQHVRALKKRNIWQWDDIAEKFGVHRQHVIRNGDLVGKRPSQLRSF